MPVSFQQIISDTAETSFSWGDNAVVVAYYPGRVTDEVYLSFGKLGSARPDTIEEGLSGLNETLSELIESWDVLLDEKTPYPTDPKSLGKLPVPFRMQALMAILSDMRPEE